MKNESIEKDLVRIEELEEKIAPGSMSVGGGPQPNTICWDE